MPGHSPPPWPEPPSRPTPHALSEVKAGRDAVLRRCPSPSEVGGRLRERRESRHLSLRELARRVAISPSALSEIETGKSRASLRVLYPLVRELEVSLDELLGLASAGADAQPEAANGHVPIGPPSQDVRRSLRSRAVAVLESGVREERLTPRAEPEIEFLAVTYECGGCSSADGSFVRGSGRQYGLVLAGALEVTIGFETYLLDPGDSIAFDSTTPHRIRNRQDAPATAVWVRCEESARRDSFAVSRASEG